MSNTNEQAARSLAGDAYDSLIAAGMTDGDIIGSSNHGLRGVLTDAEGAAEPDAEGAAKPDAEPESEPDADAGEGAEPDAEPAADAGEGAEPAYVTFPISTTASVTPADLANRCMRDRRMRASIQRACINAGVRGDFRPWLEGLVTVLDARARGRLIVLLDETLPQ